MTGPWTRRAGKIALLLQRRWLRLIDAGTRPTFAGDASGFVMRLPRTVEGPRHMHIGTDVKLGPNSLLKCVERFPGGWMRHPEGRHVEQTFEPTLVIGNRVTATASLSLVAFSSIVIEDDVMFASNVFVSDGGHAFESVTTPYKFQGIGGISAVRIGRGSWIGENAVITAGVSVGEMVIVGANAVVTRDVPPRSIVVGSPARVVRRWDPEAGTWVAPDAQPGRKPGGDSG